MKMVNEVWEHISADPKKFLLLVALVLFSVWFLFDDYGVVKRIRMEAEHRLLQQKHLEAEQLILNNELRIRNAYAPDSIEKAAREKYNFRKEGETLFIIRKK
ncbi:MAG: septum formation initiator [Chlorobiaceae bacterium]|jgi:cell division protein FtsB|nr:septum formation initiator [Chlorobiaceae bacterium]NTW63868.1 septum formation initiator [Chlorobiaceae bacterium]